MQWFVWELPEATHFYVYVHIVNCLTGENAFLACMRNIYCKNKYVPVRMYGYYCKYGEV